MKLSKKGVTIAVESKADVARLKKAGYVEVEEIKETGKGSKKSTEKEPETAPEK